MKQKLTLLTLSLLVAGWQVQAAPQAASAPQASAPAASAPAAAANSAATQPVTAVGLPEIKASAYAVYDAQSGQMLASHKLNEHIEPASLTKLMTAYLVFKALEEGKLKPDQTFTVSEQGWKVEGSRMFRQRCLHHPGRSRGRQRGAVCAADERRSQTARHERHPF